MHILVLTFDTSLPVDPQISVPHIHTHAQKETALDLKVGRCNAYVSGNALSRGTEEMGEKVICPDV